MKSKQFAIFPLLAVFLLVLSGCQMIIYNQTTVNVGGGCYETTYNNVDENDEPEGEDQVHSFCKGGATHKKLLKAYKEETGKDGNEDEAAFDKWLESKNYSLVEVD